MAALAVCLTLLVASCGGDGEGPLGECPPNSGDQQSAGSFIFSNTCTGCHSVNLQGADRQGAPVGTDYDTPEMILADAEDIWARTIDLSMPPPDGLNELQIEAVRVYITCLE